MTRQLHLGYFFFGTGYHPAGWRLPEGKTDGAYDIDFLTEIAQKLEVAKFDFFFLGDRLSTSPDMQYIFPSQMTRLEPFTLISYIAAVTKQIGLIATVNTTYSEPYNVARHTTSLDHLSKGRASWNVVTGSAPDAALNFSREKHWDNEKRYDYAEEFIEVVRGLADTWEDDSLPRNKETGQFADPKKVHLLNHVGANFSIKGPLNVHRPIQGQIPLITAGTSSRSQQLAAKYADMVFTGANEIEEAKQFYKEIKSLLSTFGREKSELKILPGIVPIVEETDEAAIEKYNELNRLIVTDFDVTILSNKIGYDFTKHAMDEPLPYIEDTKQGKKWVQLTKSALGKEELSIKDLFYFFTSAVRGHLFIIGSAEKVADLIEKWFVEEAADGFNLCPPYLPGGLDKFIDLVIPRLQQKGIFRTEYAGSTFRDHLGLERPENQFKITEKV
jgi:N-acetyl-S-(2-succino)cysteine monooxygenase